MPKIDGAEIERRVREAGELNKLRGAFPAIAFGSSRRLGISIVPLTKQLADYFDVKTGRGLLITNVAEDSAAARAGLKAGDVVVEVGTAEIGSTADFTRELNRKQEGEVELKIVRGGRERTIKATPERNSNSSFNFEEFAPEGLFNDGTRLVRPAAPRPVIVPQRRGRIL
jgi:membrane-associated protease RseP (regulator of RpoE activity)